MVSKIDRFEGFSYMMFLFIPVIDTSKMSRKELKKHKKKVSTVADQGGGILTLSLNRI